MGGGGAGGAEVDGAFGVAAKQTHSSGVGVLGIACFWITFKANIDQNLRFRHTELLAVFAGGTILWAAASCMRAVASLDTAFTPGAICILGAVATGVGAEPQTGLGLGRAVGVGVAIGACDGTALLAGSRGVGS